VKQKAAALQLIGSRDVVLRTVVSAASAGAMPVPAPAIQADRSLPPSKRAKEAVNTTSAAAAITAGSRSNQMFSPHS
jgi:hypothetical protein